jgi:hypothetical protein
VVAVTGGSQANPVRFAAGAATYQVAVDRVLDGTKTLTLRFDTERVSRPWWPSG